MDYSAVIIPFPAPSVPVIPVVPAGMSERRLANALADQHRALVAWQASLTQLSGSLQSLSTNLRALESALDGCATG